MYKREFYKPRPPRRFVFVCLVCLARPLCTASTAVSTASARRLNTRHPPSFPHLFSSTQRPLSLKTPTMTRGRQPNSAAARVASVLLMLCAFVGPASAGLRNTKPAIKQGPVVPVRSLLLCLGTAVRLPFSLLSTAMCVCCCSGVAKGIRLVLYSSLMTYNIIPK